MRIATRDSPHFEGLIESRSLGREVSLYNAKLVTKTDDGNSTRAYRGSKDQECCYDDLLDEIFSKWDKTIIDTDPMQVSNNWLKCHSTLEQLENYSR